MSSYQGIYAEHIFIVACLSRGMHIYNPIADVNGVDFIIQSSSVDFIRVQVKSTSVEKSNRAGTFQINCRKGFNCTSYTSEFDICACYLIALDMWYFIPIAMLNKTTIGINPDNPNCKYNDYKNRFDLLTAKQ